MAIIISEIRIENFRSLKNVSLELKNNNILIGSNNSGKSNFLKAINIALGSDKSVTEDDIFIDSEDKSLPHDRISIIDVLIKPTTKDGVNVHNFSEFWASVFTEKWITTDETNGDYVGIRTTIQYDPVRDDYNITRRPINEWKDSIESSVAGKRGYFTEQMTENIASFYMDAQRDATQDIQSKKSYFGKATSQTDLPDKELQKLEEQLDNINSEIISGIPALKDTKEQLNQLCQTIGNKDSLVEIQSVARKLTDLHKGMDITYKDGKSATLSISQHGMGTRSWISFLTLGAYVQWYQKNLKKNDDEAESYIMLTMEEPEAHLHPQAQKQLYGQIIKFSGQKIISTHSPSIAAQANLDELIHFQKIDGVTHTERLYLPNMNEEMQKVAKSKIRREVMNTRGELLFASAIVLCEGVTEEQALPIYFNEYFGTEAVFCGVNIIGIGGKNYGTFLYLIKSFNIPWFIFSDGESDTINTVKNAVKIISSQPLSAMKNVVILDNGDDYEHHLINSGYGEEIVAAINQFEDNPNFFDDFVNSRNHKARESKKFIRKCGACGQDIFDGVLYNYDGDEGRKRAIYDCCTNKRKKAKASYACSIATHIVNQENTKNRIPPKVKTLFDEMAKQLNLRVKDEYHEN